VLPSRRSSAQIMPFGSLVAAVLVSTLAFGSPVPAWNSSTDRLLLYTLGKTGSSSLEIALGPLVGRGSHPRIEYLESLTPDGEFVNYYWSEGSSTSAVYKVVPRACKTHSQAVAQRFVEVGLPGENLWLLILVRDPFARVISAFFQNLERFGFGRNSTVAQLTAWLRIREKRSTSRSIIDTLPQVLGEGIEWLPLFNHSSHDLWAVRGRLRVLFLRMEDSLHWPSIILRRLGMLVQLPTANSGEDKWYSKLYGAFKSSYVYGNDTVRSTLKSSQDLRLMYTENETNAFAAKALHL